MKLSGLLLLAAVSSACAFHAPARPAPAVIVRKYAPPPTMVVGRVRRFVSNRLISPFRRDPLAEEEEDAGVALISEAGEVEALEIPPPVASSDMKKLSAVDSLLVRLGVKTEEECALPEEGEDLMEQIKCAGRAGIISYILWEWAFWIGAGGLAAVTYYQATGGWPDLSNADDQAKVGASAFALVNVARFAVPLRIGLALGTTPWVDENIVKPFLGNDEDAEDEGEVEATDNAEPPQA